MLSVTTGLFAAELLWVPVWIWLAAAVLLGGTVWLIRRALRNTRPDDATAIPDERNHAARTGENRSPR